MKEARAKKNVKGRDLNPIISKTQGGSDCTKVNKLTASLSCSQRPSRAASSRAQRPSRALPISRTMPKKSARGKVRES